MTKLDFLKEYTEAQRYNAWVAMGKHTITKNTKFFVEGVIYKIDIPCLLNGFLIYCKKEFIENETAILDWNQVDLVNYDAETRFGEIAFNCPKFTGNTNPTKENKEYNSFNSNLIISPYFITILFGDQVNELASQPLDPSFIPFKSQDQLEQLGQVHISDIDYENCLKCLGYPFLTEDELEYSRKDILNFAIKPALEEYFHWIPFERIEEYPVTGGIQKIPYPNDAYDVLGVSVQQKGTHGSGNITNTLLRYFDEAAYGSYNYSGMTGNYKGTFKPHTAQSSPDSFISNRALVQATTNLNTRVHFDKIVESNGQKSLRIYSNKLGTFNIHWAIHSLNFDDVEYQQRQNVFKYCQAEIKELFGNLRRQAKADIPGAIDYSSWVDEAKTMKEEVVNDWKQLVKASSIMRGSL